MTKANRVRQKSDPRTPYPLPSCCSKVLPDTHNKEKHSEALEKKDWKDAMCCVCIEYPHNAVLLLCSSYDKGCRPYMCATSCHYSNCLEQYKKAYTTEATLIERRQPWHRPTNDPNLSSMLLCPLCRGQVKGWTVVEPARKYLNTKKRTCMEGNCSFVGTYGKLRKHVRAEHPLARPRDVDPSLAEKWKKLEHEGELNDVFSTIRSTMPGSVIMGDYVIERNNHSDNYNSIRGRQIHIPGHIPVRLTGHVARRIGRLRSGAVNTLG